MTRERKKRVNSFEWMWLFLLHDNDTLNNSPKKTLIFFVYIITHTTKTSKIETIHVQYTNIYAIITGADCKHWILAEREAAKKTHDHQVFNTKTQVKRSLWDGCCNVCIPYICINGHSTKKNNANPLSFLSTACNFSMLSGEVFSLSSVSMHIFAEILCIPSVD